MAERFTSWVGCYKLNKGDRQLSQYGMAKKELFWPGGTKGGKFRAGKMGPSHPFR